MEVRILRRVAATEPHPVARNKTKFVRSDHMKNKHALVKMMPQKQDEDAETISSMMRKILVKIGEDPNREGLIRTPDRAEKALRYITSGYEVDINQIVNNALFTHECDEMVVVKDIEFFSMCEHHLLPFFG